MSRLHLAVAFAVGIVVLLSGTAALAQNTDSGQAEATEIEPIEVEFPMATLRLRAEVLGGSGFGDTKLPSSESVNAYGPGLSVRGAYVFEFGGSLGLRYDHFFGSTSSYPLPLVALIEYQTGARFAALDVGYEVSISHALFRPHVGLGLLGLRISVKCSPTQGSFHALASGLCADNDRSETSWAFAAAPGLLMGLGWREYYGFVDIQYLLRRQVDAFGLAGGVGITL